MRLRSFGLLKCAGCGHDSPCVVSDVDKSDERGPRSGQRSRQECECLLRQMCEQVRDVGEDARDAPIE